MSRDGAQTSHMSRIGEPCSYKGADNCTSSKVFQVENRVVHSFPLPKNLPSMFTLVFCLLSLIVAIHGASIPPKSPLLTVKTHTGTYTGLIDSNFPNTRQFRSIPFAEPPISSRRWLPPVKLPPSGRHETSHNFPPSCPQFISRLPSIGNQYFAEGAMITNGNENHTSGLAGAVTSEDCLYLAMWTPANTTSKSKLPVLFFITGGGFQGGAVDTPYQHGADWVERSRSHIVVTINYRVNIFGFPNAKGLSDQNLGILDQRIALEWVRDNIEQFGGDSTKITQWGQSAGAMSSDAHAHAFYKDPIAHAYFLQSGTMFSGQPSADKAFSNFTFVAAHFGCSKSSGVSELDCMRRVPFKDIENFIGQYGDNGTVPTLSWIPMADERIVFSDYAARAREGKVARRPTIMSNTANEGSWLVPYPADNPAAGFPQSIILQASLVGFVCPTFNSTLERNEFDIPVFRYQHAGTYPNLNPFEWLGAYHGSDIPLIFGTYGLPMSNNLGNASAFEAEVSRTMQDHIIAFARDPYHGPQKMGWSPLNANEPNGGKLIRFGAGGKAVQYVNRIEVDAVCQGRGEYNAFP
ncbi:Alpha/Beta hydrolase protein [Clohesyomyces aquaticus]|uniref:Alpha/Beta hydrolase protein n=1 Tax=Clohesyomyces aquaticus TaxID=1231657 RepID=A0A1Y1YA69_9PLEO|nr:Alpha/Beta hydrolase protein [Clohesyomyces aquaticus]